MNQTEYEKQIESMKNYLAGMDCLIAAAHDQLDEMKRELRFMKAASAHRTLTPIIEVA